MTVSPPASHLAAYTANVHIMEAITRLNTNLGLLEMHREKAAEAGGAALSQ
jgi:hypothetical protein